MDARLFALLDRMWQAIRHTVPTEERREVDQAFDDARKIDAVEEARDATPSN